MGLCTGEIYIYIYIKYQDYTIIYGTNIQLNFKELGITKN